MDDTGARWADIAPGTRVVSETGMEGMVVDTASGAAGPNDGVGVVWADGSRTVVPVQSLSQSGGNARVTGESAAAQARRVDVPRGAEMVRVPIIEERLIADVVWQEAGTVRLRVRGEAVPQTETRETAHEELYVEEMTIGRELTEGEQLLPRQEGDVLIVPIIEEEVVVVTRRVLAREVRITRRVTRAPRTVDTTTRHTVVEIESGELGDRVHVVPGTMSDHLLR